MNAYKHELPGLTRAQARILTHVQRAEPDRIHHTPLYMKNCNTLRAPDIHEVLKSLQALGLINSVWTAAEHSYGLTELSRSLFARGPEARAALLRKLLPAHSRTDKQADKDATRGV